MAKILWYGDAVSNTGFSRVTHSILEHLNKVHEVIVVGINYDGDPHEYPFKIYPAGTINQQDRFGIARLPDIINKEDPDYVIALNDIWILNQVWERIQFLKETKKFKFIAYFPVDSEYYDEGMLGNIAAWDFAITFTVESAQRLIAQGITTAALGVIPHGVDRGRFSPMDKQQARASLGLPQDAFIVFNGNRNQPRKRIDLTIKAFAQFAAKHEKAMLYLHMGQKDMGWDVIALFNREMKRLGLDPTRRLSMTSTDINYLHAPDDSVLNLVYNAVDIGINTSDGEGWGLVSFEHASCCKPQIVPNHTACKDIWKDKALLIDVAEWYVDKDLAVERGVISVPHAAELMMTLAKSPKVYNEVAQNCYAETKKDFYDWATVANGFNSAIKHLEDQK